MDGTLVRTEPWHPLLKFRQPPGSQLAVLIKRIFNARAVALFDVSLGRQDRIGEWRLDEEDIAKDCFLINAARDDKETQTSERILRVGVKPVGALVVRGGLGPLVIDGLAALAALAMERHESYENEDRAEAAKRSEQLRAAVMDALAHEFKTPLTAVQTASSGLLELGGLTVLQGNLVRLIDDEAVRLNELCTRLLKTAKLNPEQVDLETNEVKVRELLSSVLASQPAEGGGRSVQISMEDPELTVRADRGLLELILKQYIDNAQKYSAPESPIEIEAHNSHGEVVISVHNFGPAIRMEDRESIFERFYRSPDVKDKIPGTGVGLSVVKKAAEAHRGHVWVISDERLGTTFYLSLPSNARGIQ